MRAVLSQQEPQPVHDDVWQDPQQESQLLAPENENTSGAANGCREDECSDRLSYSMGAMLVDVLCWFERFSAAAPLLRTAQHL